MAEPLAYFLTWHTYGTWLHGHERGSVDTEHSGFGTPFAPPNPVREAQSAAQMAHGPTTLDEPRRGAVQAAIEEVCPIRGWRLIALNVRTTHIHAVVNAPSAPEKTMNDFKAYATRCLRRQQLVAPEERIWATHGSTRYVWTDDQLAEVVAYVVDRQGAPILPEPIDRLRSKTKQNPEPDQSPEC